MAFRCPICFRRMKTPTEHGKNCKLDRLKRCVLCGSLEDHDKGEQNLCPSGMAPHKEHQFRDAKAKRFPTPADLARSQEA